MNFIAIRKIKVVLFRELRELTSARMLVALACMGGLQFLAMSSAKAHGRMEDTFLLFLLGGAVAIMTNFDLIAKEREHHTLDLLLTQGLSRMRVFIAKWIAGFVYSFLAALIFCVGTAAGTWMGGFSVVWTDLLAELGMVTWVVAVYGWIAFLFSILFRKGKWSLAASVVTWMLLRPTVVTLLILKPLQDAFGWDQNELWQAVAFIPEYAFRMALDLPRALPQDVSIPGSSPYAVLIGFSLACTVLAGIVFHRQDEVT